jgi:hypothetical protein
MRWAGHVAPMSKKRNACTLLVRKPEGKRQLERSRRRLDDNIIMGLRETGWGVTDWTHLALERDK